MLRKQVPDPLTLQGKLTIAGVTSGNAIEVPSGTRIAIGTGYTTWSAGKFSYVAGGGSVHEFDQSVQIAAGRLLVNSTDSSGSPGNVTMNKGSGQVAIASGVSTITVTNSLCTTTSVVLAVLQDNTDNLTIRSIVPASGSFVINLSGNTTAARKVGFVLFGAV